jgi:murein DD-endopeptidase MepM/ murein hydrolase activator NlpD/pimeloyl-ACP methyl ester carboxylesterase
LPYTDTPLANYNFSFYSIDLAGNLSTIPNTTSPQTGYTQSNNPNTIDSIYQTTRSRALNVYHDTKEPIDIYLSSLKSISYETEIPGFTTTTNNTVVSLGNTTTPITKDTTLIATHNSQQYSDIEYQYTNTTTGRENTGVFNNNGVGGSNVTQSQVLLNGYDFTTSTPSKQYTTAQSGGTEWTGRTGKYKVNLGNTQTDESRGVICIEEPNTTIPTAPGSSGTGTSPVTQTGTGVSPTAQTPIKNRRLGKCSDGVYKIQTRATDTPGNSTQYKDVYVERDSVRPSDPVVSVTTSGIRGEERLNLALFGEAYTEANINVTRGVAQNPVSSLNVVLQPDGTYNFADLIGILSCDEDGSGNGVVYKVSVSLRDRAGNVSGVTSGTITTQACPRCVGTATGGWANPIRDYRVRETSGYRTASRPGHNGTDLNVGQDANGNTIAGIPIYAAKGGTVEYSRYSYTDAERWTPAPGSTPQNPIYLDTSNYVIINHNDGTKSHYVHLQNATIPVVNKDDVVTTNTVIGYMGNTGQSTAPHLHFGIFVNGVDIDPSAILNIAGDTATASQQASWCKQEGEGDLGEELDSWLSQNKETPKITINFNKALWPLTGAYFKSIDGLDASITKVTRADEVKYGIKGSSDKGEYRVNGVAPYKGQDVTIKVWSGNTLVEERVEQLQSAKIIGRKDTLNIIDENIFAEKENTAEKGRFSFSVFAKWSINPSWTDGRKVTMQDRLFFDTKISHESICNGGVCKIPDGYTIWKNEKKSNYVSIEKDLVPIPFNIGNGTGIEKVFRVSGANSDTSKFTKAQSANERQIKLNLVNGSKTYNGGQVWILSHGWNGGIDKMVEIGNKIKNDPVLKNDNVFVVDWREASHTGANALDVCVSSTWTDVTAAAIQDKLEAWGVTDKTKVNLVGHSMGTILNTEIGQEFGVVDTSYSLDPPSDPCSAYNLLGNYQTSGSVYSTAYNKKDLRLGSQKARSFVGMNSLAGSQEHNRTADLSFQMDFNTLTTNSAEHAWVPQTWRQMLDTDRLDGNTLGARDSLTHPTWQRDGFGPLGWQGNHGRLFTNNQYSTLSSKEQGDGVVNVLKVKVNNQIIPIYKQ